MTRAKLIATARAYNADGFRVLVVATREIPGAETSAQYRIADEAGLTVQGFLTFLDPPKETAGPAIAALAEHGVCVKVLTGDNEIVTRKICREVGLEAGDSHSGKRDRETR